MIYLPCCDVGLFFYTPTTPMRTGDDFRRGPSTNTVPNKRSHVKLQPLQQRSSITATDLLQSYFFVEAKRSETAVSFFPTCRTPTARNSGQAFRNTTKPITAVREGGPSFFQCFASAVDRDSFSYIESAETKVYEGEVTELTPEETENPLGGYGRTVSHVVIGLKTTRGCKQLR